MPSPRYYIFALLAVVLVVAPLLPPEGSQSHAPLSPLSAISALLKEKPVAWFQRVVDNLLDRAITDNKKAADEGDANAKALLERFQQTKAKFDGYITAWRNEYLDNTSRSARDFNLERDRRASPHR